MNHPRRQARRTVSTVRTPAALCMLCMLLAVLASCDPGGGGDPGSGGLLFGINMSEGTQGFSGAYADWKTSGAQVIELNLPWNVFYDDDAGDDDDLPELSDPLQDPWGLLAATALYGSDGIKLAISLAVVDTAGPAIPGDLPAADYDNPAVIAAFKSFLDELFDDLGDDPLAIPSNVELVSLSIGNEVNYTLGGSSTEWSEYTAFYTEIVSYLKNVIGYRGAIGCKTTVTDGVFAGQLGFIKTLNAASDVVMLNYYPKDGSQQVLDPSAVFGHFDQLVSDFAPLGKDIWLMEVGYQSSIPDYAGNGNQCNSSLTKQAQFFENMFLAWDEHNDVIKTIIVDWLNDQPQWQIDQWAIDYGSSDPAFLEYLATLGLRERDGTPKPAWTTVVNALAARGW